ncbi:acyl transferase/acyl hydrolase/lysophospholipase [Coniella lustricola]|uniref:[acyl-carrier-protein] S-malonyltransferase n=1 Tax=Coniella lustricola TaxID=2025994 RepID=A0A2T3A6N6_9PEZI|nr:acyl transferase/acyl hydrolase/lysophospholipase [Coniella lustricola]
MLIARNTMAGRPCYRTAAAAAAAAPTTTRTFTTAGRLERRARACIAVASSRAGPCHDRQQQRRHASNQATRPKTALFFPGQGVQKVGMLTPWLEAFPRTTAPIVDEIDSVMGYSLSRLIAEGPNSVLSATPHAQPAIMATSILILRVLQVEFGFNAAAAAPATSTENRHNNNNNNKKNTGRGSSGRQLDIDIDFTLGHSLGEFAALVAGGYLPFADSLRIVHERAKIMAAATAAAQAQHGGEYGMVAIVTEPAYLARVVEAVDEFTTHARGGDDDDSGGAKASSTADATAEELDGGWGAAAPIQLVKIANVNSKNQIVLSGSIERIKTLVAHVRQFLGHDPRAVRLNSDSPFHSPIMRPAVAHVRRMLDECDDKGRLGFPGCVTAVSNVTARPFASRAQMKDLVARSCLETVRWWDSIRYLDQREKVRRWIGIGPGKVGRNLVGKEVGMRGTDQVLGGGVWAITDPSEVEEVLRGLEITEGMLAEEERLIGEARGDV